MNNTKQPTKHGSHFSESHFEKPIGGDLVGVETAVKNLPDVADRLSVSEVAKLCGVQYRTVCSWVRQGVRTRVGKIKLRSLKLGGRVIITRQDVDAFIAAQNHEQPEQIESPIESRRRINEAKKTLEILGVNLAQ